MYSQPNKSEADFETQAYGYGEEIEELAFSSGAYPLKAVLDGCAVSANSNLQISVAGGVVWYNGKPYVVASATPTATTADGTNTRIDYVAYDTGSTAVDIVAGTAATNPEPPELDDDHVLLAELTIPASLTAIDSTHIVDKRVLGYTPPGTHVFYVDPDNGSDPGSNTWAGWGRTPELAFDTTADAVTAASTGDTIMMLGMEGLTAGGYTISKALIFRGAHANAGWKWAGTSSSSTSLLIVGQSDTEFRNIKFANGSAEYMTKSFVEATSSVSRVKFHNCQFTGKYGTNTNYLYIGVTVKGEQWEFRNCTFENFTSEALYVKATLTRITGCKFSGYGIGISNYYDYYTLVEDSLFIDLKGSFFISLRSYPEVRNNTFYISTSYNNTALADIVRTYTAAVVTGNSFIRPSGASYNLGSDTNAILCQNNENLVSGNYVFMGSRWDGCAIEAQYLSTVTDNYIYMTPSYDVDAIRVNTTTLVSGNYVYMPDGNSSATQQAIYVKGVDVEVQDNFIYDRWSQEVGTSGWTNYKYIVEYTDGSTVVRNNWMIPSAGDEKPTLLDGRNAQAKSADFTVTDNMGLLQMSGSGTDATLPDLVRYKDPPSGSSQTWRFLRKDSSNAQTVKVGNVTNDVIWHNGTNTYTSISLASDGAMVELYYDDSDGEWVVVDERGTVTYT